MPNVHVSFFSSSVSMSSLIRWYPGMYSNFSRRLVSRTHLNALPTDSTFNSTMEPALEVTISSARVYHISSIPISAFTRITQWRGSIEHTLVDARSRKPGTISAATVPTSFLLVGEKTQRSINSETNERWDAPSCTGMTVVRGWETARTKRREREKEWRLPGAAYRERVEPCKDHKSNNLPVTPRTRRPVRRSTRMMKRVMLSTKTLDDWSRNDLFYTAITYQWLIANIVPWLNYREWFHI